MARDNDKILIHGHPVWVIWTADEQVVYKCPWRECDFQTSYPCKAEDVECRIDAYVEMHDHIKSHLDEQ